MYSWRESILRLQYGLLEHRSAVLCQHILGTIDKDALRRQRACSLVNTVPPRPSSASLQTWTKIRHVSVQYTHGQVGTTPCLVHVHNSTFLHCAEGFQFIYMGDALCSKANSSVGYYCTITRSSCIFASDFATCNRVGGLNFTHDSHHG